MAHIAGTGPAGEKCQACRYWSSDREGWKRDTAEQAFCSFPIGGKARRLFPGTAAACRLFSPVETN